MMFVHNDVSVVVNVVLHVLHNVHVHFRFIVVSRALLRLPGERSMW